MNDSALPDAAPGPDAVQLSASGAQAHGVAGRRKPATDAVDLWTIELHHPVAEEESALLDASERARAARFVFERDRRRFLKAHAALRGILGAYLGRAADALRFRADPHGKPQLGDPDDPNAPATDPPLWFNLSHSEDVAVVGVAATPLGVDVEWLRAVRDVDAMAQRHFSPVECAALRLRRAAQREFDFLCCWTRKEACLKAAGVGLRVDTSLMDVGVDPVPREVRLRWDGRDYRMIVQSVPGLRDALIAVALNTSTPHAAVHVTVHAWPPAPAR